ncbi:MAG: glucose-1-phosphate adenylyltransferase [Gemmatimonadetes bacterium]|nr:glucose-1-phosphate adenylyltransferase [Gemmatimonadota bacterium]
MNDVLAVILGGGRGTRLYPLTRDRCKPAVPLGGKYRLIDIPIANCINSGLRQIFVLTQFNSASLMTHIHRAYRFDGFMPGFVEILAAEQTPESDSWYQGTADAVRQNLRRIDRSNYNQVLILSGDQLYRMRAEHLIGYHREVKADVTLSVIPVRRKDTSRFGLVRVGHGGMVREFVEKPTDAAILDRFRVPPESLSVLGISDKGEEVYLASMGIYVFDREVLVKILRDESKLDFGKDIFEGLLSQLEIAAYPFDGYWEDIGTIGAFHHANISLASPGTPFDFYDLGRPVYTSRRYLPASKVVASKLDNTLLGEGCRVLESDIRSSVVGIRSIVREGSTISESVLLGMDFLSPEHRPKDVSYGIGHDCVIHRAIIDKNARIGDGCIIRGGDDRPDSESQIHAVRDGVVVIPKNAVVPPGTEI